MKQLINPLKLNKSILVLVLLIFFLNIHLITFAQNVGIGAAFFAPDVNAMLEVRATGLGMLIPRMTAATKPATPVTGLTYYQTDGTTGYYYYDGAQWVRMFSGTGTNIRWNEVIVPNGSLALAHATYTTAFTFDGVTAGNAFALSSTSLTTGTLFDLVSTSTAGNNSKLINLTRSGANGAGGMTNYGIYSTIANTGATSTNIAGYFSATGGTTMNYGVQGTTASTVTNSSGVYGTTTGNAKVYGVYGTTDATTTNASGVRGFATNATGAYVNGVWGESASSGGDGVYGLNTASNGTGVYGYASAATSVGTVGVQGDAVLGTGVLGYCSGAGGWGVWGFVDAADGWGTLGINNAAAGGNSGLGVYGETAQSAGMGVYAINTASSGTGVFGVGNNTGGSYLSSGSGGAFTGSRYGLFAKNTDLTTNGTGYYAFLTYPAILGYSNPNDANNSENYHFAIHGAYWDQKNANNDQRAGGVLGSYEDGNSYNAWGALGYCTSAGNFDGVYASAADYGGAGTGFMNNNQASGIGGAFYGSLMGGWARGDLIGFTSAGELYASYNLGNEYTSGYQVEIINSNGNRVAAYTNTSIDVKIYNDGIAQLTNGKGTVIFDETFNALLSAEETPTITVTPQGKCNGLYIESIDKAGFKVAELGDGNSSVKFSWIVIGKRVDAKNKPDLPKVLQAKDFDEKLKGVMFNESDTEHSGTPIWWDGTQLRFDNMPDIPNKKSGFNKELIKIDESVFTKKKIENKIFQKHK